MTGSTLIDTDLLFDCLRGFVPARQYLRALPDPFAVSAISLVEVHRLARDGAERSALAALFAAVEILPVDAAIAERAGQLCRNYAESHGVTLSDALVAATAERHTRQLATLQPARYPTLRRITTPYRR